MIEPFAVTSQLAYGLAASVLVASLGVAAAMAVTTLVPKAAPGARYRCWMFVLMATAATPFVYGRAVLNAPPTVALPAVRHVSPTVEPQFRADALRTSEQSATSTADIAGVRQRLQIPAVAVPAVVVWLTIAVWRLLCIARALRGVRMLKSRAKPLDVVLPLLSRDVRLLSADAVTTPIALGYLHPAIVMPQALLESMSSEDIACLLRHELAHIGRRDDWVQLIERVVAALLWFNPLLAFVCTRLSLERELACDREAVATTGSSRRYAELLWQLAQQPAARTPVLSVGIVRSGSHTAVRLRQLLDDDARAASWNGLVTGIPFGALVAVLAVLLTWAVPALAQRAMTRTAATVVTLRGGTTLIVGGRTPDGTFLPIIQEIDARTGRVIATARMPVARADATATQLADGTVLIAGGWTRGGVTRDALIYSPQDHRVREVTSMTYARAQHSAILLRDGRVFLTGGEYAVNRFVHTPEFFDPRARRFVRARMDGGEHAGQGIRLLPNGHVLIWDGFDANGRTITCTIAFDPQRQRFYNVGSTLWRYDVHD